MKIRHGAAALSLATLLTQDGPFLSLNVNW